ncbi:nucleoredoxin-like protein 2 isoform X2 [Amblyomma americanum]
MLHSFTPTMGSSMELWRDKVLLTKEGTTTPAGAALRNKRIICIYFSAQWCVPCRTFTPMLAEAYREAKQLGLPIEIVFVSQDRTEAEMQDDYNAHHGGWLRVPYGDNLQGTLKARYKVAGIPTLVVLKGDGALICANGRADVQTKGCQAFKDWLTSI